MTTGHVELVGLAKRFEDVEAVAGIDLEVQGGEFFSLLGPSGCGKTTTLRMIAGFERPTEGRIVLDGRDVADVPPHQRDVNTVFQSYALFPHLDVGGNVAFGLRFLNVDKTEAKRRVGEILDLVELGGMERRKPHQLSGGQQQRVALARALVLNPAVLLLDEPLGALDARLRKTLQVELKALQEQVGTTFVYVTHDQEEALVMSDRIAVLSAGRIEQVGPPREVYEEPATAYVARFLGVANLLDTQVEGGADGHCRARIGGVEVLASGDGTRGPARLVIRPERVRLEEPGARGPNRLTGRVERLVYLGPATQIQLRLPDGTVLHCLQPNQDGAPSATPGQDVDVHLPPDSLRVLPDAAPPTTPTTPVAAGV